MSATRVTVRAVDVTKNPAYLWGLAADVDKFRDEFVSFLELIAFTPMTLATGLFRLESASNHGLVDERGPSNVSITYAAWLECRRNDHVLVIEPDANFAS